MTKTKNWPDHLTSSASPCSAFRSNITLFLAIGFIFVLSSELVVTFVLPSVLVVTFVLPSVLVDTLVLPSVLVDTFVLPLLVLALAFVLDVAE